MLGQRQGQHVLAGMEEGYFGGRTAEKIFAEEKAGKALGWQE